MSKVVAIMSMSLDGYVADRNDASWPLAVSIGTGLVLLYLAARVAVDNGLF